jgi:LacI family transcriptional regulator
MTKKTATATLRHVAEMAGVSIGTASRVINGKQTVKPAIRAKVQAAIDELGYRPNAVAQSMRRRSTHIVGCIMRDINIPTLAAFVSAAHSVLDQAGFSLLISNSEGLEDRERELLMRLDSQQADGILFGPYTRLESEFEAFLRRLEAPIVLVDRDEPVWADAVMADHAGGAFDATTHLLNQGHRRILLLTGSKFIYPARERILGYRRAFAAKNVPVDEELICTTGFGSMEGFRHASSRLGTADPLTAIIAGGIDMLPGVLRAVRVRGLSIPDDISVVSVGDSELAQLHTPPISSIRWDQGEIGRSAAQILLKRIGAGTGGTPERILLPAEFTVRASTAAPRVTSGTG